MIFIDEIDAVRSLPFSTDEFFAAIRECYNRRTQDPEFERLTFCLLGVATPSDLIQDTRLTPFNIGRRIELTDFTEAEAAPLDSGLVGVRHSGVGRSGVRDESDRTPTARTREWAPATPERLLQRILYWTGGHPYLTQRLCQAVAADPNPTSHGWHVDRHCEALFLSAAARERDDNLMFVRERLLRSEPIARAAGSLPPGAERAAGRAGGDEPARRHSAAVRYRACGAVPPAAPRAAVPSTTPLPYLRVRNRIYERVFDRAWVTQHMPDAELRRQRRAYRAGLARAASAAGIVLLVVTGLAVAALEQAHRADVNARKATNSTRVAHMNLGRAQAEAKRANNEADRANRQAKRAKQAERHGTGAAGAGGGGAPGCPPAAADRRAGGGGG